MTDHAALIGLGDAELLRLASTATHQHYKGGLYRCLERVRDADDGDDIDGKDGVSRVLYQHLYPHTPGYWLRDATEFFGKLDDGRLRFRPLDRVALTPPDDAEVAEAQKVAGQWAEFRRAERAYPETPGLLSTASSALVTLDRALRAAQAERETLAAQLAEAIIYRDAAMKEMQTAQGAVDEYEAKLAAAGARAREVEQDKARLDFLDQCNHRLNQRYGTNYGWKLVLTHNVTRLMPKAWDCHIDLHDSEGGHAKLPSCRAAIDEQMAALARAPSDKAGG